MYNFFLEGTQGLSRAKGAGDSMPDRFAQTISHKVTCYLKGTEHPPLKKPLCSSAQAHCYYIMGRLAVRDRS